MTKYRSPSWQLKSEKILAEGLSSATGDSWKLALDRISRAFARDVNAKAARDIAFHLCDWNQEARFLVALQDAPGQFTPKEIRDGITACLIHIPNHIAAAATLADWPMQDIFNVGATIKPHDPEGI